MNKHTVYYASHSPLTDPGDLAGLFDLLPGDLSALIEIIQGLLIHNFAAEHYHVRISSGQREEIHLRTIRQRLRKLVDLDSAPLDNPREPAGRQIGVCRDFALLLVSMLRHQGIPARMRVGFAPYFSQDETNHDHWIAEYWDAGRSRWVLADPQIDAIQREKFRIRVNTLDLKPGRDFYPAGQAWDLARSGKIKPIHFRFNFSWKGFPCIRGNLLNDFQSLNKIELTPRDYWDDLIRKDERDLDVEDRRLLDRIARLTLAPDENFQELRDLHESLPRTVVIRDRLKVLGIVEGFQAGRPDDLHPGAASRLSGLAGGTSEVVDEMAVPVYQPYEPAPHMLRAPAENDGPGDIVVRGANQHNLRHIDVRIPRNRLVDAGNTVIVIEHNLDVIRAADWIIDLGPEGGDGGGMIVAEGRPGDVAKMKTSITGSFLSMG